MSWVIFCKAQKKVKKNEKMTRRKEKKLEAAEGVGGVGRNLGPEAGHGHRYPAKVGGAGCHSPPSVTQTLADFPTFSL